MKVLCINIASDTESWRLSQEEFKRVGLTVERVDAVVGDNRPLAFNKSVYKAMEMCFRYEMQGFYEHADNIVKNEVTVRGMQKVHDLLLFEDDVVFESDVDLRGWPSYVHGAMPPDFMTLHLGCNIIGTDTTVWQMPTPHSEHLARLWNCWQSHATLYSAECVKYILDNFNPNVLDADNMIFDEWLRTKVLPMGRSYVMKPMIAYQRPRHSSIWNMPTDYTGAHRKGNEILNRL